RPERVQQSVRPAERHPCPVGDQGRRRQRGEPAPREGPDRENRRRDDGPAERDPLELEPGGARERDPREKERARLLRREDQKARRERLEEEQRRVGVPGRQSVGEQEAEDRREGGGQSRRLEGSEAPAPERPDRRRGERQKKRQRGQGGSPGEPAGDHRS